ncbi:hypothetical protein [Sinorhizobium fredii]|uniref:hypothetical protein n=1 Tax=Rhizobium fredii TaxID=380 RepID=UPI0004BCD3A3|nr:hypothetical protein [Sinorhizobium fredii]AWM24085.1 hypothetical protein AOX55_0000808 [Sinorhizobium fredii CCBAU 25509]
MARISDVFESIDTRLKKAVRLHGLDIDKAGARVLGDTVLSLLDTVANLDHSCIAEEITRVARHRGTTLACCTLTPEALRWPSLALREQAWNKLTENRRYGRTMFQAFVDINAQWGDLHAQLLAEVGRDFRSAGYEPMHLDRPLSGRGYEPRLRPAGAA